MVNLRDMRGGYRFAAGSASGSAGGSIVASGRDDCGPEYARGPDPAGEGGVEVMPHCYGLPSYCGWQQVAGVIDVAAGVAGVVGITPTTSPYFEGKAVYMFGVDPLAFGTNLRFTVGSVDVGGAPQLAISSVPTGGVNANPELLSDVFNRSDEPLLITWAIFSTVALARQLTIDVFNPNAVNMRIFCVVWGNARDSLPPLPGAGAPGGAYR